MTVLTMAQRRLALRHANETRAAGAKLKAKIAAMPSAAGREFVAGLLEDPVWPVLSMPVGRLLLSIRRVGFCAASRWRRDAGISSLDWRVRELSSRQRLVLAGFLRNQEVDR